MPSTTRILITSALAALVLITAYTVALGGNGWLWFGWIILTGTAVGAYATERTTR